MVPRILVHPYLACPVSDDPGWDANPEASPEAAVNQGTPFLGCCSYVFFLVQDPAQDPRHTSFSAVCHGSSTFSCFS